MKLSIEDLDLEQLPRRTRGRPTPEREAQYQAQRAAFCRLILEIRSTMDFEVGARGWSYILEQRGLIPKGDFDAAEVDYVRDHAHQTYTPFGLHSPVRRAEM